MLATFTVLQVFWSMLWFFLFFMWIMLVFRVFGDIFRDYEYDFYKIDPALFAPAEVWVSNLDSGRTWHGGGLNMDLLRRLWLEA